MARVKFLGMQIIKMDFLYYLKKILYRTHSLNFFPWTENKLQDLLFSASFLKMEVF